MKKASLVITALTAIVTLAAIVIFNDDGMTKWTVLTFSYVMVCYYTELFICAKLKKIYLRLIPLIYSIIGAVITWVNYYEETLFFPQLSLIFFGIPTLLGLVYTALGYLVVRRAEKK